MKGQSRAEIANKIGLVGTKAKQGQPMGTMRQGISHKGRSQEIVGSWDRQYPGKDQGTGRIGEVGREEEWSWERGRGEPRGLEIAKSEVGTDVGTVAMSRWRRDVRRRSEGVRWGFC